MKKKEYKYSNSTVMMVIMALAMFIAFPPLARVFYPDESVEEVNDIRIFLTCAKEDKEEGYSVSSNVFYLNDEAQKNTINFHNLNKMEHTESGEEPVAEVNPNEITVQSREEISIDYKKKSIFAELEFFRNLQGVNFQESGNGYMVEVNQDSLIINDGNEELMNYLLPIDEQENFYSGLGYSCQKEGANS